MSLRSKKYNKTFKKGRNVGDVVRIKEHVDSDVPFGFSDRMECMLGKSAVISYARRVTSYETYGIYWAYRLKGANGTWNEYMFQEGVTYDVE